jgi:alanine dehydrogenase
MLILTEEDVQRLLPMKEAVRLMREAFAALGRGEALDQPRRRLILPTGAVLHQMAASFGGYFGTKIYSTHVKHGANFTFLLYDAATAKPLAQMEANFLGQIRTGAVSGLATDLMAPPQAKRVGLIGSGFQAWTQLEAMLAVRPIDSVKVWSRSRERRAEFAERASRTFQVEVLPVDTAEAAVRGAELIATATFAKEPVLDASWVAEGAHLNAAGANMVNRRELPSEVFDRARLIAVDSLDSARNEAGDLLLAKPADRWTEWPLIELSRLSQGELGPASSGDLTVFKSVGMAVEDVAAGSYVFEQAMRQMGWERG